MEFTKDEAALYVSMRVAFGDKEFKKEEQSVISEHYGAGSLQALLRKIDNPMPQADIDAIAIEALEGSDEDFQLKTLAIGVKVSNADGEIQFEETTILSRFAKSLGLSPNAVQEYYETKL